MAYDADGNFYNPYSPGTYEYDYEESQRSQPTVELTPEQQAQEIASYNQYQNFLAENPAYVARAEAISAEYNKPQTSWMDTFGSTVLAVALLVNPTIGLSLGSAILGSSATGVGAAVGLSATQVASAVGASALSAATTALSGGTVEDVIRNAAGAGVASGINFGMGGGVPGAVTGSVAGTIIKGGDASQVLTNAFAAGVGAGVQGAMTENPDAGKILGSAARTYIATGGNIDQTLLNTAATAIGTLDQPTTYAKTTTAQPAQGAEPFKYGNDTYQELEDGTAKVTTQSGNVRILSAETFNEIKQDYASDVASGAVPAASGPVIPPQTVAEVAPVVSPTVTDLDLVKQVAAQTTPTVETKTSQELPAVEVSSPSAPPSPPISPEVTGIDLIKKVAEQPAPAVDPAALEKVIVQGQGANVANVAPVETTVPSPTVPSAKTIATPTPEQPFPTPTVTPEKEAEVVTDVPVTRPDTTAGLIPPQADLGTVNVGYVTDPFVDIAPPSEPTGGTTLDTVKVNYPVDPFVDIAPPTELEKVTVTGTRDLVDPFVDIAPPPELDKVTVTGQRDLVDPFVNIAPPTKLEKVTVTGTRDLVDPFVDIAPPPELEKVTVTDKSELPPEAPTIAPDAPEVKAEEPKKEEPKKEEPKKEPKNLYPTVTSVPPPKKPRAPPIITGASPARLLADALAAYRPAGAIEGEESGKERQNVWNEKSLRLKDALGL